jgi:hypothetical protein
MSPALLSFTSSLAVLRLSRCDLRIEIQRAILLQGPRVRRRCTALKIPHLEGDNLTFDVRVLEGDLGGADGPASVFVDIIGLPFTPLSFAGVARRTARRAA